MGAEIWKLERPGKGDSIRAWGDGSERNAFFRYINRNKKSITLDYKQPEGKALFLKLAREGGLDVGGSIGASIVPIVTGSSIRAGRLAQALFDRGVNVQPILYPAVPERAARLRFFLTASHTEEQIRNAVAILLEENRRVAAEPSDLAAVARHLGKRSLLSR